MNVSPIKDKALADVKKRYSANPVCKSAMAREVLGIIVRLEEAEKNEEELRALASTLSQKYAEIRKEK